MAELPISITQMIIDSGIVRQKFNRTLQIGDGFLVITHHVMNPAKRVRDITIRRTQGHSTFNHLQRFIKRQFKHFDVFMFTLCATTFVYFHFAGIFSNKKM